MTRTEGRSELTSGVRRLSLARALWLRTARSRCSQRFVATYDTTALEARTVTRGLGSARRIARCAGANSTLTTSLEWTTRGYIFIVGRRSEIIKSGGHRIGPQEIEEVVAAIPGVTECAVVGVPDALLGQSIAVFVVRSHGAELDEAGVKRGCFQELPRFKVPSHVRFVPSLPRSDRGKLLRSALGAAFVGAA